MGRTRPCLSYEKTGVIVNDNIFASMGLTCADCSYFEGESEDGTGVCLTSVGFGKVNARVGVCGAFTQRGCERAGEKKAIENLRNKYIREGVTGWRNPFAK